VAELVGENAGCSGDHGNLMAQPAQLQGELAYVSLRAAENVPTGEHVDNFHAPPRLSFANSWDGRKVSLLGRPHHAERRFQTMRHSASSASVGAFAA
jgi:hypothetical protein